MLFSSTLQCLNLEEVSLSHFFVPSTRGPSRGANRLIFCLMGKAFLLADISDMNVDDRNANSGSSVEGAISSVSMATATIEVEESEVVCIDTPTSPQINLIAMLEEAAPIPQVSCVSSNYYLYFGRHQLIFLFIELY